MSLVLRLAILVWVSTGLRLCAECSGCGPQFYGQVLAEESAVRSTNAIGTLVHDLHVQRIRDEDKVRVARVRIEWAIAWDEPIPIRIPVEVLVYYYPNQGWTYPHPVALTVGERRTFRCDRGYVAGQRNVLKAFWITP